MHYTAAAAAAAADTENVQVCRKDSLLQLYGDHEVILSRSLSLSPQSPCFRSLSWVSIVLSLVRPGVPACLPSCLPSISALLRPSLFSYLPHLKFPTC